MTDLCDNCQDQVKLITTVV